MKILVFLHGTTTMHKNAVGRSHDEILHQVASEEPSIRDFSSYVPVGNAVRKLKTWQEQGAQIEYLSSRRMAGELEMDESVLAKYSFPEGPIHFRQPGETYKDVAERIVPDILIEDDCECIGGAEQMTITFVKPEIKQRIKSIVIKEFGGIDHLPDQLLDLLASSGAE
jgi:hypothetical protein